MTRRFVVISSCDGAVRVYGPWREHYSALAFADKINAGIERTEEAEIAAYQRGHEPGEMMPHLPGAAYVRALHKARVREAIRFALTGNPDKPS